MEDHVDDEIHKKEERIEIRERNRTYLLQILVLGTDDQEDKDAKEITRLVPSEEIIMKRKKLKSSFKI